LACQCHLQIDPYPAYHFDADLDYDPANHFDAEPDPDCTLQFDADPCGSGSLTLVCCVVDRHRFDIDPDPIRISILMPIQIRIWIGTKTVQIHM
jgi:hypothetical protein